MRRALLGIAAFSVVLGACSEQTSTVPRSAASVELPAPTEGSPRPATTPVVEATEAPTPSPRPAAPTLRIMSPASAQTASLPLDVRYEISGFDVGPSKGHVHVGYGRGPKEFAEMPVPGPSGSAVVDGLPEGTYDLVFSLVRADHTAAGPVVTVRNVTLITRGAGGGGPGGY